MRGEDGCHGLAFLVRLDDRRKRPRSFRQFLGAPWLRPLGRPVQTRVRAHVVCDLISAVVPLLNRVTGLHAPRFLVGGHMGLWRGSGGREGRCRPCRNLPPKAGTHSPKKEMPLPATGTSSFEECLLFLLPGCVYEHACVEYAASALAVLPSPVLWCIRR